LDVRVDFLTMLHRGGNRPVVIPNLNIALQPLKFMEYSMEHPLPTVVFCDEGAVTVNAPVPARYAVHKLIVRGERARSLRTKSNKDLRQAAALISYFAHHQPEDLVQAWLRAAGAGKTVRGRGCVRWCAPTRTGRNSPACWPKQDSSGSLDLNRRDNPKVAVVVHLRTQANALPDSEFIS
jgi:hypothetical protein